MRLTRKQKRILIAKAIKYTILTVLVVGILTMLSSIGILESQLYNPIYYGVVRFVLGLVLTIASLFIGIKIYT